jgi:hypothetical protein
LLFSRASPLSLRTRTHTHTRTYIHTLSHTHSYHALPLCCTACVVQQQPQQYMTAATTLQPVMQAYAQPAEQTYSQPAPVVLAPPQALGVASSSSPSAYATVRGSPTSSLADSYAKQTTYTNPLATVSRATAPTEMRQEVAKVPYTRTECNLSHFPTHHHHHHSLSLSSSFSFSLLSCRFSCAIKHTRVW